MIKFRVDLRALEKAKETAVENVNRKFRAHVYKMFEDALMVSAQFSGDYVSNWRISVDSPAGDGYQMWPGKTGRELDSRDQPARPALYAGHLEAVAYARQLMARKPFNYKQKIYFTNSTPLTFTGKTVTGLDGKTENLRPENLIGSGVLLASYLRSKYGVR